MNKPSRYWQVWRKIEKEKQCVLETTCPARLKKAIVKRKHLAMAPGYLSFRVEVKKIGELFEDGDPIYLLHVAYVLPVKKIADSKEKELA